jgi:hypothetical protein
MAIRIIITKKLEGKGRRDYRILKRKDLKVALNRQA